MPQLGHYDPHPPYGHIWYDVFKKAKCRQGGQMPVTKVEGSRGTPWFGGTGIDATDAGANGAGILYEWLTDPVTGRGLPDSALHQASWETVRVAVDPFRISPYITNQQDLRSYVAQLCEYFGFWLRPIGTQIELGMWERGDIDVASLPEVGNDDLTAEPDLSPGTYDDCVTKVTVKFCDRTLNYKEVPGEPYYNPHIFRIIGEAREELLTRLWIIEAALANQYATEYGIMHSRVSITGSVPMKRERAKALGLHKPGKLFVLNWATRGLSIVMRSSKVLWPADRGGEATLTVENERGLWPQRYVQPHAPTPGNFVVSVPAIVKRRIWELPSGLKDASAVQIAVLAQRPTASIVGFRTHTSVDNDTFDLIGSQETFAFYGKIVSVADYDLRIEVFGVDELPGQTATQAADNTLLMVVLGRIYSVGQVNALGSGIYRVMGSGTDGFLQVLYGTIETGSWPVGEDVFFVLRANIVRLENRNFLQNATRYFKLQPFTQASEQALSGVTSFSYQFSDTPAVNSISGLTLSTGWEITSAGVVRSQINVVWDAVAPTQDVVSYEVGIKLASAIVWQTRSVGASTSTAFNGLLPGLSYDVRVRAFNAPGEPGLWSFPASIVTHPGMPAPRFGSTAQGVDKNNGGTFETPFDLYIGYEHGVPGSILRWRADAGQVTSSDTIQADSNMPVGTVSDSGTYSAAWFDHITGQRGPQRTVTFTKITIPPPGNYGPPLPYPSYTLTGSTAPGQNRTLTITAVHPGATPILDGGSYSSPYSLEPGETVHIWQELAGYTPSPMLPVTNTNTPL